jgi:predicted dehydrogenase
VSKKKLKVGIIGTGSIATWAHMPGYQALADKVEVVAFCDIKPDVLKEKQEKFEVKRGYLDYNEMLEKEELDAVSICTPNYAHKDPTIAALKAGIHVLCEKPIGMSAKEGYEMDEAAKKYGKILQIGFCWRWGGPSQAVKRYIDDGAMGEIYHSEVIAMRRRGIPGWGVFGEKDKQGGGPLIDIGVHAIDLALHFMGYPKPVSVSGASYQKFGKREGIIGLLGQWNRETFTVEDFAAGLVKFDNGTSMTIMSSFCANRDGDPFNVKLYGTEGGAEIDPCMIYREEHGSLVNITPVHIPKVTTHSAEIADFVDAILEEKPSPVPGWQGAITSQIIDAIYESQDTGREIVIK